MQNRSISSPRLMVSAAALLALALGPAHAQQTQQDQQTQQQDQQSQQGGADQQATGQGTATQPGTGTQPGGAADSLVATVGEEELRASDVMAVIDMMPPRLRQQPQEMLVPMALEQVVLRELILQQAMSENLNEDAEVIALVEENARVAQEDAMVGVWLRREMESRITDERVQETYDRLQSESEEELPPLEEVRPQIEQHLGREAMQGIRSELGDTISVVYYGPDGQPVETTVEAEPGTAPAGQDGTSGTAGTGTGAASGTAGSDPGGTATGTGDTGAGAGSAGTGASTSGTGSGSGGTTTGTGDTGAGTGSTGAGASGTGATGDTGAGSGGAGSGSDDGESGSDAEPSD